LSVAEPYIRALVVLILETGMRSHKEALPLWWDAVDITNDSIRVRESKTRAGIRNIPLSTRCKAELIRWREMIGLEFSPLYSSIRSAENIGVGDDAAKLQASVYVSALRELLGC